MNEMTPEIEYYIAMCCLWGVFESTPQTDYKKHLYNAIKNGSLDAIKQAMIQADFDHDDEEYLRLMEIHNNISPVKDYEKRKEKIQERINRKKAGNN